MSTVLSIAKSLDLLEAVIASPGGIGTRELARRLGISVTTVHNIARTLTDRGYLRQDAQSKQFGPGTRLFLLSRAGNLQQELATLASPYVRSAMEITGETAMLSAFEQGRAVRLVQIASRQALCVREQEDLGGHVYCTATGKMLLSTLPLPVLQAFLAETPLIRHTQRTLATPAKLMADLSLTRDRGYALTSDELQEGISAVAVSVCNPWGAPAAALGVSAPTQRFGAAEQRKAVAALRKLSQDIARAWAGSGRGEADRATGKNPQD